MIKKTKKGFENRVLRKPPVSIPKGWKKRMVVKLGGK